MTGSPFAPVRPARIRIDTDSALQVDVLASCYVAVYPDPNDSGKMAIVALAQNPGQVAELTAAIMRYATTLGVMQSVMASLTSTPTQIEGTQYAPKPPGTPPDDLPPHLRPGRKS